MIFMLMSIEIMFNAAGLVFIIASTHWKQPDGQVMFIFILAVTAVEGINSFSFDPAGIPSF